MTISEIEQIREEIAAELVGLRFGKIFQLDRMSIAIDFFPHSGRYLFISFGPKAGAAFLIRRRLKTLEREAVHPNPFAIDLKNQLGRAELLAVSRVQGSRALQFDLQKSDGAVAHVVVQLGGDRSNVFLLDQDKTIVLSGRSSDLLGQRVGDKYAAPDVKDTVEGPPRDTAGDSLSDFLDAEYRERRSKDEVDRRVAEARRQISSEIRKRTNLIKNLENDLLKHGDPDRWKRYGDLLLANMGNIRRNGDKIVVTDYFDAELRDVEIPADANALPSEIAEGFFKRYTKARNGAAAISERLETINKEIASLSSKLQRLEDAVKSNDEKVIADYLPEKKAPVSTSSKARVKKEQAEVRGARRFISSDGFEILVGKKAVDNDQLTFRVARSLDTWLHAADYPGSHVIVRNPGKKELPSRTLVEAAQLAAFYSDAREIPKAAVRYTLRKHVNKPRKAAPGLVSLATFKTILVEPRIGDVSRGDEKG